MCNMTYELPLGGAGVVIRFEDFTKHTLTLGVRYTFAP